MKNKIKFETSNRKSVFCTDLGPYHKEHDFIEVTEWTNGEGWDITISDTKQFSLHFTEFDVIKQLIEHLENETTK
jgi:hypothetical protein